MFSVISQEAAARYALHRSMFSGSLVLAGPAGQEVRAIGHCGVAIPQEKAADGNILIFVFIVDKLEEVYETPYGGLERWHMQLAEEDEKYMRWMRTAQPGDRPYCELTLEEVTLDPARVSRSTWTSSRPTPRTQPYSASPTTQELSPDLQFLMTTRLIQWLHPFGIKSDNDQI